MLAIWEVAIGYLGQENSDYTGGLPTELSPQHYTRPFYLKKKDGFLMNVRQSNWIPRKSLVEEAGTITYNHRELMLQMIFGISCPRMFCFSSFQKYGPGIATDVLFSSVSLTFSQILLFQSGGEQLLKDSA